MKEQDFLEYAETLTAKEIEDIISKLHKIEEERADATRRALAKKVKDAIDEYLKLGEEILVSGQAWDEEHGEYQNIEATFERCCSNDGRLTFYVVG